MSRHLRSCLSVVESRRGAPRCYSFCMLPYHFCTCGCSPLIGSGWDRSIAHVGLRPPVSAVSVGERQQQRSMISDTNEERCTEVEPERLQYKVILLGDGTVGKTSIATRFARDDFSQSYKQTIGLDFFVKRIILPDDVQVTLQIWDIGGQSIGSKMMSKYIFGAHAVVMCYDITNYDSFQNLDDWYRLVVKTFARGAMPYVAMVGNKCDLSHLRAVRTTSAHQFADDNNMFTFFMSAKSGDQVDACFHRIAGHLSGIALSRPQLDAAGGVINASIVNHKRHDEAVYGGEVPDYTSRRSKNCTLM